MLSQILLVPEPCMIRINSSFDDACSPYTGASVIIFFVRRRTPIESSFIGRRSLCACYRQNFHLGRVLHV